MTIHTWSFIKKGFSEGMRGPSKLYWGSAPPDSYQERIRKSV